MFSKARPQQKLSGFWTQAVVAVIRKLPYAVFMVAKESLISNCTGFGAHPGLQWTGTHWAVLLSCLQSSVPLLNHLATRINRQIFLAILITFYPFTFHPYSLEMHLWFLPAVPSKFPSSLIYLIMCTQRIDAAHFGKCKSSRSASLKRWYKASQLTSCIFIPGQLNQFMLCMIPIVVVPYTALRSCNVGFTPANIDYSKTFILLLFIICHWQQKRKMNNASAKI